MFLFFGEIGGLHENKTHFPSKEQTKTKPHPQDCTRIINYRKNELAWDFCSVLLGGHLKGVIFPLDRGGHLMVPGRLLIFFVRASCFFFGLQISAQQSLCTGMPSDGQVTRI